MAGSGAGMGRLREGELFGHWTVGGSVIPGTHPQVACRCDCGTERNVDANSLAKGTSTRCRKCSNANNEKARLGRQRPLSIGKKVGLWTVVAEATARDGNLYMKCRCECGAEHEVMVSTLRHGKSKSCAACARAMSIAEKRKISAEYGGVDPMYRAWQRMISRCSNPKDKNFERYGARGIKVCDEWQGSGGFEAFLAHVGRRPSLEHSLDRIDNDSDYEPGNIRWATRKEQQRNTRRNCLVTIDGVTKCVAEWAEESPVSAATIYKRLGLSWSDQDAVFSENRRP